MPTNVFIQNRSTLTLSVTVRQEGDRTLTEGTHWRRGATIVALDRRDNRNRGITRGRTFYFLKTSLRKGSQLNSGNG
jgi:hypothetical protein